MAVRFRSQPKEVAAGSSQGVGYPPVPGRDHPSPLCNSDSSTPVELPSTRGNGILDPIPPYLRERIAEQDLAGPVARRFGQELERLAQIDGWGFDPVEAVLITRLVTESPGDVVVPAPFDALWPHADLFLSACLYVAVSDGLGELNTRWLLLSEMPRVPDPKVLRSNCGVGGIPFRSWTHRLRKSLPNLTP